MEPPLLIFNDLLAFIIDSDLTTSSLRALIYLKQLHLPLTCHLHPHGQELQNVARLLEHSTDKR